MEANNEVKSFVAENLDIKEDKSQIVPVSQQVGTILKYDFKDEELEEKEENKTDTEIDNFVHELDMRFKSIHKNSFLAKLKNNNTSTEIKKGANENPDVKSELKAVDDMKIFSSKKIYKCELCTKPPYSKFSALEQHKIKVHGIWSQTNNLIEKNLGPNLMESIVEASTLFENQDITSESSEENLRTAKNEDNDEITDLGNHPEKNIDILDLTDEDDENEDVLSESSDWNLRTTKNDEITDFENQPEKTTEYTLDLADDLKHQNNPEDKTKLVSESNENNLKIIDDEDNNINQGNQETVENQTEKIMNNLNLENDFLGNQEAADENLPENTDDRFDLKNDDNHGNQEPGENRDEFRDTLENQEADENQPETTTSDNLEISSDNEIENEELQITPLSETDLTSITRLSETDLSSSDDEDQVSYPFQTELKDDSLGNQDIEENQYEKTNDKVEFTNDNLGNQEVLGTNHLTKTSDKLDLAADDNLGNQVTKKNQLQKTEDKQELEDDNLENEENQFEKTNDIVLELEDDNLGNQETEESHPEKTDEKPEWAANDNLKNEEKQPEKTDNQLELEASGDDTLENQLEKINDPQELPADSNLENEQKQPEQTDNQPDDMTLEAEVTAESQLEKTNDKQELQNDNLEYQENNGNQPEKNDDKLEVEVDDTLETDVNNPEKTNDKLDLAVDDTLENEETLENQSEKTNDKLNPELYDNLDEIAEKSFDMKKTDFKSKQVIEENLENITEYKVLEYKSKIVPKAMDIDVILDDNLPSKLSQNGNVNVTDIVLEKKNIVEDSFEVNNLEDFINLKNDSKNDTPEDFIDYNTVTMEKNSSTNNHEDEITKSNNIRATEKGRENTKSAVNADDANTNDLPIIIPSDHSNSKEIISKKRKLKLENEKSCPSCEGVFTDFQDLKNHISISHDIDMNDINFCNTCEQIFLDKKTHQRHQCEILIFDDEEIQPQPNKKFRLEKSTTRTKVKFEILHGPFKGSYQTIVPKNVHRITLGDAKSYQPNVQTNANYRYYVKTKDDEDEEGVLWQEFIEDSEILPIFKGKIVIRCS